MIVVSVFAKLSSCKEAEAESRSLDLSWRPLSHSPYQQQFFQSKPSQGLISYAHFDHAHQDEIVEAAKHNAHMLKQLKEIAHQPITSYSDPYQAFPHTPAPIAKKYVSSAAFLDPNLVQSASNHALVRVPYPGQSLSLYQTKLNYLGKPDSNPVYLQNNIHQTMATTPKIAGYTKENGRLNFHYHHPSFGMTPISSSTKKTPLLK